MDDLWTIYGGKGRGGSLKRQRSGEALSNDTGRERLSHTTQGGKCSLKRERAGEERPVSGGVKYAIFVVPSCSGMCIVIGTTHEPASRCRLFVSPFATDPDTTRGSLNRHRAGMRPNKEMRREFPL